MKQIVERKLNEVRAQLRAMPKAFTPPKCTADRQKLLVAIMQQYLRYLSDCIRGEYWDRVLVRHPELRMYNTVVKKFEIFQAQVRHGLSFVLRLYDLVVRRDRFLSTVAYLLWVHSE
jgi:hypothetical protein